MTVVHMYTVEDLLALPHRGRWHELIEGELRTMSPSNFRHGDIALTIGSLLRAFAHPRQIGRVVVEGGFTLARRPDSVVGPDVAFVRQSRMPTDGGPEHFFEGPPDLAVEIVSPNDRAYDIEEKIQLYLRHGTAVVWLVSPKTSTVTIHRPGGAIVRLSSTDTLTEPALLPGFACTVADLFGP